MIKQNELRVDNLILHDNNLCRVIQIGAAIWVNNPIDKTTALAPKYVEGIRLTPEILEKVGFKKYGGWFIFNHISTPTSINISLTSQKLTLGSNEEYRIDAFGFYLHSLQNLYFALTGQELII